MMTGPGRTNHILHETLESYKESQDIFVVDPVTQTTHSKQQFHDMVVHRMANMGEVNGVSHVPVANTIESMADILAHALLGNTIQLLPADREHAIERMEADCDLLVGSSGSTGSSKRIRLTWEKCMINSTDMAHLMGANRDNTHMLLMPLHHVNSLFYSFMASFIVGQRVIVPSRADILSFWRWVEEYDVCSVNVSPTIVRYLNSRNAPQTTKLLTVISASAALKKKDHLTFKEKTGIDIIQGYGLSEATNFSTVMPLDNELRHAANQHFSNESVLSVGNALPGHDITVASGESQGELLIKSPSNFEGYLGDDTQHTSVATGDVGYSKVFRGKHFWFLKGRTKEIIKYRDETLYPQDIEQWIQENLEDKIDFFCFGFENRSDGESIGILVDDKGWSDTLANNIKSLRHRGYAYYPRLVMVRDMDRYVTTTKKPKRLHTAQQVSHRYQDLSFGKKIMIDTTK